MRESDRLTSRMHLLKKFGLSRVARTKTAGLRCVLEKKSKRVLYKKVHYPLQWSVVFIHLFPNVKSIIK